MPTERVFSRPSSFALTTLCCPSQARSFSTTHRFSSSNSRTVSWISSYSWSAFHASSSVTGAAGSASSATSPSPPASADFFDSACSLRMDGSPSFCEELAADVTGITYVHADPDGRNNYYWVVACNSGGCSEIDRKNPARQVGTESTGSTGTSAAPSADRAALLALYNAMDGANWRIDWNWLSEKPIRRWHGVTTNGNGRVTALRLSGNGLRACEEIEL